MTPGLLAWPRLAWHAQVVADAMGIPSTITAASTVLRQAYCNLLWDLEQVYFHLATGPRVAPPRE